MNSIHYYTQSEGEEIFSYELQCILPVRNLKLPRVFFTVSLTTMVLRLAGFSPARLRMYAFAEPCNDANLKKVKVVVKQIVDSGEMRRL